MTEFDALRAAREELQGLMEVHTALTTQVREAEEAVAKHERALMLSRKLLGYVRIEIEEQRAKVEKLTNA